MAIAKVVYKESSTATPSTWMDVTQKTVTSATMLSSITALKNDGTNITGTIATKSVGNLWFSSSTATFGVPTGYYSGTGTIYWTIASKGAETFTPAETVQTISSYQWLTGSQTIAAISSDYVGTAIPRQGVGGLAIDGAGVIFADAGYYSETVSRNMNTVSAKTITPTESIQMAVSSHYFTTGHISVAAISSTYVGTGVPSGTVSFNSDTGEFTVKSGYFSSKHVTSLTTSYTHTWIPTESVQVISSYQWLAGQQQINAISSTYVGTGVSTKAATTIYPSTVQQTIASQQYLTGAQTFAPVTTLNLEASYISSGITVKIGDSANAGRIANVTGTLQGAESFASIYKHLALNSAILFSDTTNVSNFCNSLSIIFSYMFAGRHLSGNFQFNNVTRINEYAFGLPYTNGAAQQGAFTVSFPLISNLSGRGTFVRNRGLKQATFPNVSYISSEVFVGAALSFVSSTDFPLCESIGSSAFLSCDYLSYVSFPNCKSISYMAFAGCYKLEHISFPICEVISNYAFSGCTKLAEAIFPSCTYIGNNCFYNNVQLASISFPVCSQIGSAAFYACSSILTANFQQCSSIGMSGFYNCYGLQEASFPECLYIEQEAFRNCSALTTISAPKCRFVGANAFAQCKTLTNVNLASCTSTGTYAFDNCNSLSIIEMEECSSIASYTFRSCASLSLASFRGCTSFGAYAFAYCYYLVSLYLGSTIPTFGAGMFQSTPISTYSTSAGRYGSIYVPSSMLDTYKTATNWTAYSARMVGY